MFILYCDDLDLIISVASRGSSTNNCVYVCVCVYVSERGVYVK